MKNFTAVALAVFGLCMVSSSAQRFARQAGGESYGPPTPYQYAYTTEDKEGSSSAQESSDGSGRVTGSYSLTLADGRQRTVTYWADESGFHADVITNELGTESKNPADVTIQSSAPTGDGAAPGGAFGRAALRRS